MPISSSTIVPGYSDVETYVDHENDFVCVECKLSCDVNLHSPGTNSYISTDDSARIVAHLSSHLSAGHLVPQPLIEFWQDYSHSSRLVHYGLHHHRIVNDNREPLLEREFANAWVKQCKPSPGYNRGEGILADLMWIDAETDESGNKIPRDEVGCRGFRSREKRWTTITPRDSTIVATVIQWLGTNCGQSFLDDVFRKAGSGGIPRSTIEAGGKDVKSRENKNSKVSVWWWNPSTGVKCWVNVSGGHHTPTRPAIEQERHCVIVDGVEYYR